MAQQFAIRELGHGWEDVQERVFTRWCNTHLKKRDPPREIVVGTLCTGGLDDGIQMWELVTQISNEAMTKPDRRGKMKIHFINNHQIVMAFVKSKIKLVAMGPEDIVNRNRTLILGYIWTLILRYQIGGSGEGSSARQELLKWLRSIGIMVNDLTTDFSDGKQICNLVNKIRPGLIRPNEITNDALANVQKALDISLEEFDIPKVLDAADMAQEDPDELANMTYLSYFRDKYNELISAALAGVLGPNPRESQAKKPFSFQVKTTNVKDPSQFETIACDTQGKKFPMTITKAPQADIWDFSFVPPAEGTYTIDIAVGKKPVKNAPMVLHATPAPWAQISDVPEATATRPCTIKLQTGLGLKPHELHFELIDSTGKPVPNCPATIKDTFGAVFECVFTPPRDGDFKVNITYKDDGLPCKNAPAQLRVKPKPQVLGFGDGKGLGYYLDNATVGKPTVVPIDVIGLKPHELEALITPTDPSKPPIKGIKIVETGPKTMELTFVPAHAGPHTFNLKADGGQVPGLPQAFDVKPKPTVTSVDVGPLGKAIATRPVVVPITCVNIKPDDLKIAVTDPRGKELKAEILPAKTPGDFTIKFTPQEEGPHVFNIIADGEQVKDLPKKFNVTPKPQAHFTGALPDATASKPYSFPLNVINLKPDEVDVKITDERGNPAKLAAPPKIKDNGNGTFSVDFTPLAAGPHNVNVLAEGTPITAKPVPLNIKPKPTVLGFGDGKGLGYYLDQATVGKPCTVPIDVIGLKPNEIEAIINPKDGSKPPIKGIKIIETSPKRMELTFVPVHAGPHVFNMKADNEQVAGLPQNFEVKPKPTVTHVDVGPLENAIATLPVFVPITCVNIKPEDLNIAVTDPQGKPLKAAEILPGKTPGDYVIKFVPLHEGPHVFNIIADGEQVKGLPKKFQVTPKPQAHFQGPLPDAIASKPYTFPLTAINLKPNQLVCNVTDERGNPAKLSAPPKIKDNGDGTFSVDFTPLAPGPHHVNVLADGTPITAKPVPLNIKPKPQVLGFGDGKGLGYYLENATVGKPCTVPIDVIGLKPNEIEAIINPKDTSKPGIGGIKIIETGPKTMELTFVPVHAGPHVFNMKADNEQVAGLPYNFEVKPKPTVTFVDVGPLNNAIATRPVTVPITCVNIKPDDLKITVTDPEGKPLKSPEILPGKTPGDFTIKFIPLHEGPHVFNIIADEEQVKGLPKKFNVTPKPQAHFQGALPSAVASKPYTFILNAINLKPDDIAVNILDDHGRPAKLVAPPKVRDNLNGTFSVDFTPLAHGPHNVNVLAEGTPITAKPVPLFVAEKPMARVDFSKLPVPVVSKPCSIIMDAVNLKPEDLAINLTDENGKPIPFKLTPHLNDGTISVDFVPQIPGKLNFKAVADGTPVEGTPLTLTVLPKPSAKLDLDNLPKPVVSKPCSLVMDAVNLKPDDLKVELLDADGKKVPFKLTPHPEDGTISVDFIPTVPGKLSVKAIADGTPVDGTPLILNVAPKPSAKVRGGAPLEGIAKKPFILPLDVVNCKPDQIDLDVRGPDNRPIPFQIVDAGPGLVELKFVPKDPGVVSVRGNIDGEPIDGFPLTITIADAPWARVNPQTKKHVKLGDPLQILLDVVNVKPEDLDIQLPFVPKQRPAIRDNGNGTMTVVVMPEKEGPFKMSINLDGKPIEGCPLTIDVDPKTKFGADLLNLLDDIGNEHERYTLVPYTDLKSVGTNQPVLFHCVPDSGFVGTATSLMFKSSVIADEGPNPPSIVKQTPRGDFEVRFTPTHRTRYVLGVTLSDNPIKNSPCEVIIRAMGAAVVAASGENMKIGVAVPKDAAVAKTPFYFKITYSDVPSPSEITCRVTDPTGAEYDTILSKRSNSDIDVEFTPQVHGFHKITPYYEGVLVSGNMGFECSPEPTAKVIGPQERNDGERGVEYCVKIGAINCVLKHFKFAIKGPTGGVIASFNISPNGTDSGILTKFTPQKGGKANPNGVENGIFDISFTPHEIGTHTFVGFLNGKPLGGAPVTIHVGGSGMSTIGGSVMQVNMAAPSPRGPASAASPRSGQHGSPRTGQPAQFGGSSGGGQPAQFGGQPAQFGGPSGGQPAQFGGSSGGQPAQFGGSPAQQVPVASGSGGDDAVKKSSSRSHRDKGTGGMSSSTGSRSHRDKSDGTPRDKKEKSSSRSTKK